MNELNKGSSKTLFVLIVLFLIQLTFLKKAAAQTPHYDKSGYVGIGLSTFGFDYFKGSSELRFGTNLSAKWKLGFRANYSRMPSRAKENGLSGVAEVTYYFYKGKRIGCYGGLGMGYEAVLGKMGGYCTAAYFKQKTFKWLPFTGIDFKLGRGRLFLEFSTTTTISRNTNYYTSDLRLENNQPATCPANSYKYFLYGAISLGYVFEF